MSELPASAPNAAWVVVPTSMPAYALERFCEDVERLFRIHPCLEFDELRALGGGRWRARYRNLALGQGFERVLALDRPRPGAIVVRYDAGIKRATHFEIAAAGGGSTLTVTDEYAPQAGAESLGDVDPTLRAWGSALRDYLRREARWGHRRWWQWLMRRLWLPMKPMGRRIMYLLLVVSVAEVALITLVLAIFWAERGR